MTDFHDFIPIDKSWTLRMGVLDFIDGKDDVRRALGQSSQLPMDVRWMLRAFDDFDAWGDEPGAQIHVGESGTLCRFLQWHIWARGLDATVVKSGTLRTRRVCDDPSILDWPLAELLTLDGGTSQWASAAILHGAPVPTDLVLTLPDPAMRSLVARSMTERAVFPKDATLVRQARSYVEVTKGEMPLDLFDFEPESAEDFCFARAFGMVDEDQARRRWPQLANHESDRFVSVLQALLEVGAAKPVTSRDHRVVQAVAMRFGLWPTHFEHPECVSKSWPQFWEFMAWCRS